MPRLREALSSTACLILVEPEVETMVLPLSPSKLLTLAVFLVTKRFAVMKVVGA